MFQFYNLIPSLTVRENVALVTDIATHPMTAEEALELRRAGAARSTTSRRSSPAASSSAWRSRARSPSGPDVLLCDEPTGALDYATGKVVLEVIARINRELGTTAVVITHNAAIAGMADRVLHLADGRIAHVDVQRAQADAGGAVLVKALDRKLLRDLWQMRSQVVTVALVVGSAFSGFAGSLATYYSLGEARERFYESARFGDVFADVKRAPRAIERRIAEIPGVGDAETTVVFDVTLDVAGVARAGRRPDDRAAASDGTPRLDRLVIRRGRAPEPRRRERGRRVRGLRRRRAISARATTSPRSSTASGRRCTIVGVGLSPEYIFATRGGAFPDDRNFGVLWIARDAARRRLRHGGRVQPRRRCGSRPARRSAR